MSRSFGWATLVVALLVSGCTNPDGTWTLPYMGNGSTYADSPLYGLPVNTGGVSLPTSSVTFGTGGSTTTVFNNGWTATHYSGGFGFYSW